MGRDLSWANIWNWFDSSCGVAGSQHSKDTHAFSFRFGARCDSFKMDVHVDSDFLGLCGQESRVDPDNVKSRIGHVILLNECPIIWSSHLNPSICTSTMMAEYYALSTAMREVLPLRNTVQTIGKGLQIDESCLTTFHVTICRPISSQCHTCCATKWRTQGGYFDSNWTYYVSSPYRRE